MKPNRSFSPITGRCAAVAALLLLLSACASSDPPPTLLTIPAAARPAGIAAAAAAQAAPAANTPAPVLMVRRLGLPEYVQARRVRYRADASTLAEWPNTFWAERIEIGLAREFIAALRQALPGWQLCDTDCPERSTALSVQVELAPLDFVRSRRSVQAHARIAVAAAGVAASGTPRVLRTLERSFEVPASADTAQAHAQALSDLLEALAPIVAEAARQAR